MTKLTVTLTNYRTAIYTCYKTSALVGMHVTSAIAAQINQVLFLDITFTMVPGPCHRLQLAFVMMGKNNDLIALVKCFMSGPKAAGIPGLFFFGVGLGDFRYLL